MEIELRQNLLHLAALFSAARAVGVTNVWRLALNDPKFAERLRDADKTFNVRTYDRAVGWFSENWPAEIEWPDAIARPFPAPQLLPAPLLGTALP